MTSTLFDGLPAFEGRDPVGTSLSLSGQVDRRTRPFAIGEQIVLVVEATVTGVNHKETKGGILRVHALAVADAYELGGGRKVDLLETLHEEYVAYEDAVAGRVGMFGPDGQPTDDAAAAAAGAGPEARAEEREELAALDAWAHSDEALEVYDTVDAALAAVAALAVDDEWGDFDPEATPDFLLLQELRTWAQDAVAAGTYTDEDDALAALIGALAIEEAEPATEG